LLATILVATVPPLLKAASSMDWAVVDLILFSLFAVSITTSLFTLSGRLRRIEKHKIFKIEGGHHETGLLSDFFGLQHSKPSNDQLDGKDFQSFVDLKGEKKRTLDTRYDDQKS
jgi:hypothetical protein